MQLGQVLEVGYFIFVYIIRGCADYEDDEGGDADDDPDALSDPLYQVDLQTYLTEFIQSLAQLPCYASFSQHHNQSERQVLAMIGINV